MESKEQRLNISFSECYSFDEALEKFIYLSVSGRAGGCTTKANIIQSYLDGTLGTLLKNYDPVAFYCACNDLGN